MQPSFMSNGTAFQCGSHLVSALIPGVCYKPDPTIGSLGLSVFSVGMHVFTTVGYQVCSNSM